MVTHLRGVADSRIPALGRDAAAGDRRAFERLARHCRPLLCSCALAATADPALAEDAVQEALAIAWQRIGELRDPDRVCGWLCGIVRNVIRARRRHASRHAPDALFRQAHAPVAMATSPSPVAELMAKQRLDVVWREVSRLPDRYRMPLLLHYGHQQTTREVAAVLALDETTVRQRLSRGRAKLRKRVANRALGVAPPCPGQFFSAIASFGSAKATAVLCSVMLASVAVHRSDRVDPSRTARISRHTPAPTGHSTNMKLTTVVLAATVSSFAAPSAALAEPTTRSEPKIQPAKNETAPTPRRVKSYNFEGDNIRGDGILPSGDYITSLEEVTHTSLIRVRESFVREIIATAWTL